MRRRLSPGLVLCALAILATFAGSVHAEETPVSVEQAKLLDEIRSLDAKFFEAYNRCDLLVLSSLVADDLEFYDDRDGLEVSRKALLDDIEKYICGKVRRELTPGTLEVHPIPGYGALEIGAHRFCEAHAVACPSGNSASKFIHIWRKKDGAWKLARAVSYGHF